MDSETNDNNNSKSQYNIIFIACILILLIVFLILRYFFIKNCSWNIVNQTSLIGTLVSFLGFCFTILQILRLKSISKITQNAVENSLNRFSTFLTIADLSSYIEVIKICQNNINENKIEIAQLRLQSIKRTLIEIKSIHIKFSISEFDIDEIILIVTEDLNSLSQILSNPKKQLNIKHINANLENIITLFSEIVVKIKYNKDGREN